MRISFEQVAPVLHADFAGERLMDEIANARQLGMESIKCRQRPALVRRRQQAGQIAVSVGLSERCQADILVAAYGG
jgi:hypothetical protein